MLVILISKSRETPETITKRYNEEDTIYFMTTGPGKLAEYEFGYCVLEEKLKILIQRINADYFFHSTLEVVNSNKLCLFILIFSENSSQN